MPIDAWTLHAALAPRLDALAVPRRRFTLEVHDELLMLTRTDSIDDGELVSMLDDRLEASALAALADVTPALLAAWVDAFVAAWARADDTVVLQLASVLTTTYAPVVDADDVDAALAAAIVDEDLVHMLLQAIDPAWWDQPTIWEMAWQAAGLANAVVLERLLKKLPSLAIDHDAAGYTLLHNVVERCDQFSLGLHRRTLALLLMWGADVEAATDDGIRPLHIARAGMIADLVAAGARLEARTADGKTALLVQATERDGFDAMSALLLAGADVDSCDDAGTTADEIARHREEGDKLELLAAVRAARAAK